MFIVDREEFLSFPENTVFSLCSEESASVADLRIKGATVAGVDYYEQVVPDFVWNDTNEMVEAITAAVRDKARLEADFHVESRNGMLNCDQRYAVWEEADILALINRLKECLGDPLIQLSK